MELNWLVKIAAFSLIGPLWGLGCTSLLGDFTIGGDGGVGPTDSALDSTSGGDSATDARSDVGDAPGDVAGDTTRDVAGDVTGDVVADSPACTMPKIACNGMCVDPTGDAHNCGRCGHDCLGGMCAMSVCQPLLLSTTEPGNDIATDGTHVFWTTNAGVYQVDVSGLTQLQLFALGQLNVAVSGPNVFTDSVNPGNGMLTILKAQVGVANSEGAFCSFGGAAGSAGMIYDPVGLNVWVVDPTGPNSFAVWSCGSGNPMPMFPITSFSDQPAVNTVSDGTYLYVAGQGTGFIDQITLAGVGNVSTLRTMAATPNVFGAGGNYVYWGESGSGILWRNPFGGSPPKQSATAGPPGTSVDGIAADTINVYWTVTTAGTVSYAPRVSGTTTVYVTLPAASTPMRMTTDGQALYWLQGSSVYKVALP